MKFIAAVITLLAVVGVAMTMGPADVVLNSSKVSPVLISLVKLDSTQIFSSEAFAKDKIRGNFTDQTRTSLSDEGIPLDVMDWKNKTDELFPSVNAGFGTQTPMTINPGMPAAQTPVAISPGMSADEFVASLGVNST